MLGKLAKITLKSAGKVGAIVGGSILVWEGGRLVWRKLTGYEEYDEDEE